MLDKSVSVRGDSLTPMSHKNPYKPLVRLKVLVKEDLSGTLAARQLSEYEDQRPKVRADCQDGGINQHRPCPWYSCRYHLGLDINEDTGSMMVRNLDTMIHTCTLDVADIGGVTLEEVGDIVELTRERVRQIEVRGAQNLGPMLKSRGIAPETHAPTKKTHTVTAKQEQEIQQVCDKPLAVDPTEG